MLDISYQANTFHISHHGRPVGKIHSYQNPYHQTNIYLRLDLVDYDCKIAKQLFQSLQTSLGGKPLQVMLSSAEQERIHFLTAAGFVCKRKCYEFEVTKQDYLSQTGTSNLSIVRVCKGTALYQRASQQIFDHYQTVHQNINPWTASQEDFDKDLPDLVYTDSENWTFIENNEIAYVCGKDQQSFDSFIQAVICQLFEQYEQINFEADNCDPIAMHLADQFRQPNKPSWDTYILDS